MDGGKHKNNNDMDKLTIKKEEGQLIDVYLKPYTEVFKRKKQELIKSGMSDEEAERWLFTTPIPIELYYDIDRGLWGIESEAAESCEIHNPYIGEIVPNENLEI